MRNIWWICNSKFVFPLRLTVPLVVSIVGKCHTFRDNERSEEGGMISCLPHSPRIKEHRRNESSG